MGRTRASQSGHTSTPAQANRGSQRRSCWRSLPCIWAERLVEGECRRHHEPLVRNADGPAAAKCQPPPPATMRGPPRLAAPTPLSICCSQTTGRAWLHDHSELLDAAAAGIHRLLGRRHGHASWNRCDDHGAPLMRAHAGIGRGSHAEPVGFTAREVPPSCPLTPRIAGCLGTLRRRPWPGTRSTEHGDILPSHRSSVAGTDADVRRPADDGREGGGITRGRALTWATAGAGDENRTRTVSLGS
ncbi:MAG: hypothetical protein QOJ60_2335 [Actinomycetota bacterium]|nr:hypothetical protein [Actinomycetota bacterium]